MQRRTPTVAEVVRRAVEVCDPDGQDPVLGRVQQQLEDDDRPVTAVQNLEEHLALALEGVDREVENPAVSVVAAVALYLTRRGGNVGWDGDPDELIRLAVRAQWHGDPPSAVAEWVGGA
jgi:hypothetical protein